MKKSTLLERVFAIGVIFIFLIIALNSAVGLSNVKIPLNIGDDGPIPIIEGSQGQNNWYISVVAISFSYDPKIVDEIQYYLNGAWHVYYNTPFIIDEDGDYAINWFWIDMEGEAHDGNPIIFRIDMTPPTIKLTKKYEETQVTFTAACSDSTSDVQLVEFYLDDKLIETDDEEPYIYIWSGDGYHFVYAVGYNYAGLNAESNKLDTQAKAKTLYLQFFNNLFQRIYNIYLIFQQIYLN